MDEDRRPLRARFVGLRARAGSSSTASWASRAFSMATVGESFLRMGASGNLLRIWVTKDCRALADGLRSNVLARGIARRRR